MKKLRIPALLLAVVLAAAIFAPTALALDDPQVDCYAAVLLSIDGANETVLYTKNENDLVYPASLTKIMTVLLAVEAVESGSIQLSDPVTAQPGFDFDMIEGGTSVWLMNGEIMTLENLLYCAMVASANDACNVIAQYVSGSISAFVDRMNQRAAELGCVCTHFTNTHGLPDLNHYTSAWDFSRILREAVSHELFMTICNTVNYTVPATNCSAERALSSTNSLINPNNPLYPGDYFYEYAQGIKTGHTNDAGYCLASSAEKDGIRLLSLVMNGQAYEIDASSWYYAHFADSRNLFDWAFNNFSYQEIVKSTEIVADVPVSMGADADSVSARPSTSIMALLPNDVDLSQFERNITVYSSADAPLEAPVNAGQVVGEISVSKDGVVYGTASLVTSTAVDLSRVQYMKGQIGETLRRPVVIITFWALVLLIAAYILLVVRYRSKRRAYQRRLAEARQFRLDLEDEAEEVRYVQRPQTAPARTARRAEVALTPDSFREETRPVPGDGMDEPTRVDGLGPAEEPTRTDLPVPESAEADADAPVRDYFEEFFGKK